MEETINAVRTVVDAMLLMGGFSCLLVVLFRLAIAVNLVIYMGGNIGQRQLVWGIIQEFASGEYKAGLHCEYYYVL